MTYQATPTFWLEPTGEVARGLRRYSRHSETARGFDCAGGYHQALTYLDRHPAGECPPVPHTDPRWPSSCADCGQPFSDGDEWQDWTVQIYRRPADGAEFVLHASAGAGTLGAPSAPPGAMWDAHWYPTRGKNSPDGIMLMVRLPNGHDWMVDAQAANCTRPGQPHACWVRHGDPKLANVTVDKNGDTCAAGAGSILAGDYHGFLTAGVLTAG